MDRLKFAFVALLVASPAAAQQCGTLTTCPPVSTPLAGTELLYTVQGGVSKKMTVTQLGLALGPYFALTPGVSPIVPTTNGGLLWDNNGKLADSLAPLQTALPSLAANQIYGGTGAAGAAQAFSLGAGVPAWLITPTSANLAAAITDETGTGSLVFANGPAINLSNATGLPTAGLVNNAVTNAKAAQMAAMTFKGNATNALANAQDLTVTQVQTLLATIPSVNSNTQLSGFASTYSSQILRLGYAAAGDSPAVLYTSSGSACSLNSGAGDGGSQVPTSDSKCWLLSLPQAGLDPRIWGAVGNGSTDDSTALKAMFAYVATLPTPAGNNQYPVTGLGKTYATSLPLTVPSYMALSDIQFTALAGGSWLGGSATLLSYGTNGVLYFNDPGFVTLTNVTIDANRIQSVQCIYGTGENYNIFFTNVNCRRWKVDGNGIVLANGFAITGYGIDSQEWLSGDAEFGVAANQNGMAIAFFDDYDSIISDSNFADTLVPMYVDYQSNNLSFANVHVYQNCSGTCPTANPYGIIYDGYGDSFTDTYLDSCPILLRVTSSTNSSRPQILFNGTRAFYNSGQTTFAAWVNFTTNVASTPLWNVNVRHGSYSSGGIQPFNFTTTGGGSWAFSTAALATLNAAGTYSDPEIYEPGSSSIEFPPNANFLGEDALWGNLNHVNYSAATTYTLSTDDSGTVLQLSSSSATAITAPASLTSAIGVKFVLSGHAGTIQAGSGGTINGLTTAISLVQNKLYELVWVYGTGANAQYNLMGSGI